MSEFKNNGKEAALSGAILTQVWSSTESGRDFDRWLADLINTPNTTVYDKAIDSVYLETHVGGSSLHHLVDGQHDLLGAFQAARNALPDDSLHQEIMGTAHHLMKDLFSVSGLPIVSISAETYRSSSHWIRDTFGIPLRWQGDLMQVNAMELLGGSISAVGLVLGLKKKDVALLGEVVATSGLAGLLTANPFCLITAVLSLSFGIKYAKKGKGGELVKGGVIGGGTSGAIFAVNAAIGGVVGVGLGSAIFSLALSLAVGLLVRRFLVKQLKGKSEPENQENFSDWEDGIEQLRDAVRVKLNPTAENLLATALLKS